jgi:hypothetical protein
VRPVGRRVKRNHWLVLRNSRISLQFPRWRLINDTYTIQNYRLWSIMKHQKVELSRHSLIFWQLQTDFQYSNLCVDSTSSNRYLKVTVKCSKSWIWFHYFLLTFDGSNLALNLWYTFNSLMKADFQIRFGVQCQPHLLSQYCFGFDSSFDLIDSYLSFDHMRFS